MRRDRENLFHDAQRIVGHAIEREIGQQQDLQAVELACALQTQQGLLDRSNRHSAVHAQLGEWISVEIDRQRAAEDHAVGMRFVAVVGEHDDVTRGHQGLHHDLVRRRCPVGDEVGAAGAKRARCKLLRLLERTRRL